jgi:hypothetical protein
VILLPEPSAGCQGRNREIVIPVEVPQVQVVHTADLRVLNPEGSTSSGTSMATIGQLLVAELHIKHTRVWDTGKVNATLQTSVEPRLSGADAPLEFTYEIHANPDQWLIGGGRRVQFAARVCPSLRERLERRADDPAGERITQIPYRLASPATRTTAPSHRRH